MLNSDLLLSRLAKLSLSLTERKLKSLQNMRFFSLSQGARWAPQLTLNLFSILLYFMFYEIPSSSVSAD